MAELKPCPFCGGEIEERGGSCNYGKHIMTLDLKCKGCESPFKFKVKWATSHSCKAGDVLKIVLEEKPRFKKLDDGKFVKTGEVETVVKMFKILEEV